ncbi:MAG: N-acetylmuramoyl-L-alanine amidase [Polyangiales bacterium]
MAMSVLRAIEVLAVHHSASSNKIDPATIRQWHLDRGWDDVGYHYLIDYKGHVHVGRPLPFAGAHAKGSNSNSIGVCVIGNNASLDRSDHWTTAQNYSLLDFISSVTKLFPTIRVVGHRDLMEPGYTECPGLDIATWPFGRHD